LPHRARLINQPNDINAVNSIRLLKGVDPNVAPFAGNFHDNFNRDFDFDWDFNGDFDFDWDFDWNFYYNRLWLVQTIKSIIPLDASPQYKEYG